jgi:hypothetical protein
MTGCEGTSGRGFGAACCKRSHRVPKFEFDNGNFETRKLIAEVNGNDLDYFFGVR